MIVRILSDSLVQRKLKLFFLFCREVLACDDILNMQHRADWKECKVSQEQEKQLANAFKKIFKPYDFNL